MNRIKLKEAEEKFYMRYPGGFSDPRMLEIVKKHKLKKMRKLAQHSFSMEQSASPSPSIKLMILQYLVSIIKDSSY
jgi:hypothetical protein